MTVIINYENIAPNILERRLSRELSCFVMFRDIDEDYFEISVLSDDFLTLQKAENILSRYV